MARVSVIVLTHNRSKLLRIAIDSVLAQTYKDIEIIVVDDASTDDTAEVVASYGAHVVYVRKTKGEGPSVGRNTGLQTATGEFISFLDDDDFYLSTKIEKQVAMLDARPEIGAAYCRYFYADIDGTHLFHSGLLPDGKILSQLVMHCFVVMHAPLTRRECFERVGNFDTSFVHAEDWDLWMRMAQAGYEFGCVQEPLVAYRKHGMSLTAGIDKWRNGRKRALDRLYSDLNLPADVQAQRSNAYAAAELAATLAFYADGDIKNGKLCLSEALTYDSKWCDADTLLATVAGSAFDPRRVADPIAYLDRVYANLPECAGQMIAIKKEVYAAVYLGMALRAYAKGDWPSAQCALTKARDHAPSEAWLHQRFIGELGSLSNTLPVSRPKYVANVFAHLPASAVGLKAAKSRIIAIANISDAYENYHHGNRAPVPGLVLAAVSRNPALLKNRGVLAIFFKSLKSYYAKKAWVGDDAPADVVISKTESVSCI